MAKSQVARFRHAFRFKLPDGRVITSWAKVKIATKYVTLLLKPEHVRRSMQLEGVGNTQTCSMAVCALTHRAAFPHPVDGFIDWYYNRAYIVSKVSRQTGLPTECIVYAHRDSIARLNDTKGGQKQLLRMLEKNGDRLIRLSPPKRTTPRPGRSRGRNTGDRTRTLGVGARLRFAVAQRGGVPQGAAA